MASLQLKGINKIYPSGSLALYDVNLQAEDKEFIVITGGEKCGKSTLLRIIAGLEEATEGEVQLDDTVINDVDPKDRNIAMIFQGNTLYPALNVYDNMAYGLKLRKTPAPVIEQRVKAVAKLLGVEDILYRKLKGLTAMQKQKITLGRALVREPKLYLFDESFAGLDDDLKAQMLSLVVSLQARMQGSFVYATKNLAEAMTIATRVVVLKDGFVQQIDTPINLYNDPANAYVAFFTGSNINFIKNATLSATEGGIVATFQGGSVTLPESVSSRIQNKEEYVGTGKPVLLAIRPEDCSLAEDGLQATIAQTEKLGDALYAECDVNDQLSLTVPCVEGDKGNTVHVAFNTQNFYLFDEQTQLTILSRSATYANTGKTDADFVPMTREQMQEVAKEFAPVKAKKKA